MALITNRIAFYMAVVIVFLLFVIFIIAGCSKPKYEITPVGIVPSEEATIEDLGGIKPIGI